MQVKSKLPQRTMQMALTQMCVFLLISHKKILSHLVAVVFFVVVFFFSPLPSVFSVSAPLNFRNDRVLILLWFFLFCFFKTTKNCNLVHPLAAVCCPTQTRHLAVVVHQSQSVIVAQLKTHKVVLKEVKCTVKED